SAFGDTGDSLAILEINAKAAAAGLATTTEAINLTSAVTKGYGDTSAAAVQHSADLAFETVKLGQTTFPELAASIGLVVPLAASLGVAQEELFGVMATGTGVTGSASAVATQLRGVLQSLMAPTKGMEGLLADMGYASGQAMLDQLGLQGAIGAITAAAQKSGAPLQDYIGSIEGQTLALALAGPQADVFAQKLAAMSDVTGAVNDAFVAQTEGVNATGFAMAQAATKGAVLAQKLGDGIAPALLKLLDMAAPLVDWLIEMADQFANADAQTQGWIVGIGAVVAAAGPVLGILGTLISTVGAIIGAFSGASAIAGGLGAALAAIGGPVTLVIAALAGLVVAWNTDFLGMRTTIEGWMGDIGAAWPGFVVELGQAWEGATQWMAESWDSVTAGIGDTWASTIDWLAERLNALRDIAGNVARGVAEKWQQATDWLASNTETAAAAAGLALVALTGPVGVVIAAVAGLKTAWDNDLFGMRTTVEGWIGDVGAAWPGFVDGLGQAWDDGMAWMQDAWADTATNLQSAWSQFSEWLPQNATEMSARTQEVFAMMGAGIEEAFRAGTALASNVWGQFAEWLGVDVDTLNATTVQAMKNTAAQITDGLTGALNIWTGFTDGLQDAWEGAIDGLKSTWDNFAGWITGAVQGVGNTLGGIWDQTAGALGGLWGGGDEATQGGGGLALAGAGANTFNITQNFYGAADAPAVRGASRDGVLEALRQIGGR
ncbi:MAG: phage tail tape measure protein, partial [Caldilineaceae bacterium]|nr:phage tail tape measure protein [Caldilineaceae bacterium]